MLLSVAAAVLLTATGSAQNTEISSTDGLRVQSSTSRWYDLMSQTMPLDRNGIRLELPQYDGWYKYMGPTHCFMDTNGHAVYRMNTDTNTNVETIEEEYLEWSSIDGKYQLLWFINGDRTGSIVTLPDQLTGNHDRGFAIMYDSPQSDESWAPTTASPTTASPTTASPTTDIDAPTASGLRLSGYVWSEPPEAGLVDREHYCDGADYKFGVWMGAGVYCPPDDEINGWYKNVGTDGNGYYMYRKYIDSDSATPTSQRAQYLEFLYAADVQGYVLRMYLLQDLIPNRSYGTMKGGLYEITWPYLLQFPDHDSMFVENPDTDVRIRLDEPDSDETWTPSESPTTASPTTASPTTASPTTASPTTASPTTASPTTASPTTASPTTASPT
eukprot:130650_1